MNCNTIQMLWKTKHSLLALKKENQSCAMRREANPLCVGSQKISFSFITSSLHDTQPTSTNLSVSHYLPTLSPFFFFQNNECDPTHVNVFGDAWNTPVHTQLHVCAYAVPSVFVPLLHSSICISPTHNWKLVLRYNPPHQFSPFQRQV